MLLNFKLRFAPMVEEGSKGHTIRAPRKNRPKPGEVCHCFTGLRTRKSRLLGRWRCIRVEDITIHAHFEDGVPTGVQIWIAGDELSFSEANLLCWKDGFRSGKVDRAWFEFCEFWLKEHRKRIGIGRKATGMLRFLGDIIYWDFAQQVRVLDKLRMTA